MGNYTDSSVWVLVLVEIAKLNIKTTPNFYTSATLEDISTKHTIENLVGRKGSQYCN